jgi:1-deoxy-D-xylulose-5-phosphate synthase
MNNLLENITGPADLKKLPISDLKLLSEQIRHFILSSVSKTGGHLASNLGVVELTVALHYVFDFSTDKLLWDVGHQCYAHKIITGRKNKFQQIRQRDGISGFPDPRESPYDQFIVGHAGTSIPSAIGMALGQGSPQSPKADAKSCSKIVAVVGDASIVNGLSFEALNNLGLVKRQLLIVLNDNSMAIDATQGAVAKLFSKIRLSQTYEDLRKTTNNILEHLPGIGKTVEEALERIKKSIRMALPASQLFESLNIPYFGPVDGHDIASLVKLFKALANIEHPAILHVYTKKGKGFTPAENDQAWFHSTGPFNINGNGLESDVNPPRMSFTDVFGSSLVNLAQKDKRVVAITAAMCDGTGLSEFSKKFPDRFYDVGIAESAAVDIAAGLAKAGMRPFVCIYSTFLQRAFDQIFQEIALQNLPVVFCIDRAGLVGSDGPTHHGLMDIGFLRMMPNITLTAVANEIEVPLALEFALNSGSCVCIRYPREKIVPVDYDRSTCSEPFTLGKAVTVKKAPDSQIAVVCYGSVLDKAISAAVDLERDNIKIDVFNARFASPIDVNLINLLKEGKNIITVEDHNVSCGFGSALLEKSIMKLAGIPSAGRIKIIGVSNPLIKRASRNEQLIEAGICADNIKMAVLQMLADSPKKGRKITKTKEKGVLK